MWNPMIRVEPRAVVGRGREKLRFLRRSLTCTLAVDRRWTDRGDRRIRLLRRRKQPRNRRLLSPALRAVVRTASQCPAAPMSQRARQR